MSTRSTQTRPADLHWSAVTRSELRAESDRILETSGRETDWKIDRLRADLEAKRMTRLFTAIVAVAIGANLVVVALALLGVFS